MNRFEPVKFFYQEVEYNVEPDRVWGLIKTIEDHITFTKLTKRIADEDIPQIVIAEAYAAALRYAGCRGVTPYEMQMEVAGAERIGHAYALWSILSLTQPDFQEKLKAKKQAGTETPAASVPAKKTRAKTKKAATKA